MGQLEDILAISPSPGWGEREGGVIELKNYGHESRTRLRAEALQRAGKDTVFLGQKKGGNPNI